MNKCPKCGSNNIGQFRMMTGPIWCCECDYRVEEKEYFNPFVKEVEVVKNTVIGPIIVGEEKVNNNLTEIVAILDRSGSMHDLVDDTIGGYNNFIEEQKKVDGDANVTLAVFDTEYEMVYNGINIDEVKPLTKERYYARGMTALLDAIGKTINFIGDRLEKMKEEDRPGKVIFLITTDGLENASREFSKNKIAEMVKHQEDKYSWEFIFMGANIDSFGVGAGLGFSGVNTTNYDATSDGINTVYSALSSRVSATRSGVGGQSMVDYMKEVEELVEKEDK